MKKIVGNKVRASQGGEALDYELGVYYSNSLNFIAVKAHVDINLDANKSKIAGVKIDNKLIFQRKFDNVDIITDARNNEILSKWVIFHNGNIDLVLDYLKVDMINSRLYKLEKIIRELLGEKKKVDVRNPIERKVPIKSFAITDYFTPTNFNATLLLNRIPMWIRRIFSAV